MATNIKRDFKNIKSTNISSELAERFDKMIDKVDNMIRKSPVYSVWIRFQLGKTNGIIFDTSSIDPKENLISSLSVNKTGAGCANQFTLNVKYDPFNFGQNPSDSIEKLDEMLAKALSQDFSYDQASSETSDYLRGYLQYGYNNTTNDDELVSPKYEFYLTNAESDIDTGSGSIRYTFSGCSILATDSEYTDTFEEKQGVNLIQYIGEILYKYYGDESNVPDFMSGSSLGTDTYEGASEFKYAIDIDSSLIEDSITTDIPAKSDVVPMLYCQTLLDGKMSKSDTEDSKYSDLSQVAESQKPRYQMYITDEVEHRTIHLTYTTPLDAVNDNTLKLTHNFTWAKNINNIVHQWKPKIDLRLYLLQKSRLNRIGSELQNLKIEAEERLNELDHVVEALDGEWMTSREVSDNLSALYSATKTAVNAYKEKISAVSSGVNDYPGATMTLIGIPADLPISCQLKVTPIVLQSQSRTAGWYMVQSSKDIIGEDGTFSTEVELFRLRGFDTTDHTSDNVSDVSNKLKNIEDKIDQARTQKLEEWSNK